MIKTASTSQIIKMLRQYEFLFGPGSVTSIGSVTSGNREVEYVFHLKSKFGHEHTINVPSIDEKTIWEGK